MEFSYSDLTWGQDCENPAHFTWHADANFSVVSQGVVVFQESNLLVGELAYGLRRWLNEGAVEPFEYTSIEFDESGVLFLRPVRGGRWLVGSVLDDDFHLEAPGDELAATVLTFCETLGVEVKNRFAVDLYAGLGPTNS